MLVLQMFLKAAFENTFRTNPTKSKTHARLIIQKITIGKERARKFPKRNIEGKHECDRAIRMHLRMHRSNFYIHKRSQRFFRNLTSSVLNSNVRYAVSICSLHLLFHGKIYAPNEGIFIIEKFLMERLHNFSCVHIFVALNVERET